MATQYTRRSLFKILTARTLNSDDPLFEKYRRRNYSTRRYAASQIARVNPVNSGLLAYAGPWTLNEAAYLLRRTQFGLDIKDADTLKTAGMNASVDRLLNFTNTIPSPPVNYYQNRIPDENGVAYGGDWTKSGFPNGKGFLVNNWRTRSLAFWSLGLALNQESNIREKMALFWYHFIPIDFNVVRTAQGGAGFNSARICYNYMSYLRENCVGNFREIIRNIATQPAMMFYLNNQVNSKNAPDENFAREVMELFTLGKGPATQYTQNDVVQAAKVLTGWRVRNLSAPVPTTVFENVLHDTSTKTFSSFFNNTIISPTGASELDAFFDMIFSKSVVVSEYICRRLYRFFVYYDIDDNIEQNVIKPLARVFVDNNWDIKPVLSRLFKSQHFYDMANRGAYIKSPLDLVAGSFRTFNINSTVSDPTNFEAQYRLWETINVNFLQHMQQVMGSIPNVSGWNAYYQEPSYHEYWINSSTTQRRFSFLSGVFDGYNRSDNGLTTRVEVDVIAWVQQFPNAICADPDLLVNECVKYLLPIDLSTTAKNKLKTRNLLAAGLTANFYWTDAWDDYVNNPTNITFRNIVKNRLKRLLLTITQLAEYQLM